MERVEAAGRGTNPHDGKIKSLIAAPPELRALRELKREYPDSPYLFVTERGGPMTPAIERLPRAL